MNTKKIALLLVIIVILMGATVLFSKKGTSTQVKIGVIDVLSGDKAALGQGFQKGVEMARDEYVASHSGSKIDLVFEDDGYDEAKGVAAYNKLVKTDKVDALIVATSPSINAIYSEVSTTSLPVISYGTQDIPEKKDNIFHIFADPIFADMALGLVLNSLNASTTKDVVGVYTYDETLVKFYNAFKQSLGANISEFALNLSMDNNPTAIRGIATKVTALHPKYIFMTNYANLASQFIKEFQSIQGTKSTFVFDLTLNQSLPEYEKTLGDLKKLDGSLVVVPEKTNTDDFGERYKKKYGEQQGELAAYGYDSLMLLLETKAANSTDWLAAIEKVKTKGVTGSVSFDENGRRIPGFSIGNIVGGKLPEAK